MQKVKPALLRGFDQEYLPHEQLQFNALIDLVRRNFERFGFLPIETPSAERKEVLFQLAQGHAEAGDFPQAIDLGHELANLDFSYRDIGRLIDDWQSRLQKA